MTRRRRIAAMLVAVMALLAIASPATLKLRIALEDRADPHPRQMTFAAETALVTMSLLISWSAAR